MAEDEEEQPDAAAQREGTYLDDVFGAIVAGDAMVHAQPPLGQVAEAVEEGDADNPPKRQRRWGEPPGGGDGEPEEKGEAQKRKAIEAKHLGVLDGWRVFNPAGRRRGALTNLSEAGEEPCELCRWEGVGSTGVVIAELNAQYENYASGAQGRSGMWDRIASIYNARVVHTHESYGGTFVEAWDHAIGKPPRRVTANECLSHFTNKCGNDIVRPHRESRLHSLHHLYNRLDDELLVIPDRAGAGPQYARVDRGTAKLMLSTAAAIERMERLFEAAKHPVDKTARTAAPRSSGAADTYEDP